MNQKNIYLKITQPNISATVPVLIPLKGLIGANTAGSIVSYHYKGTSSVLAIAVQLGEQEGLKETINRAIVAAIKGGEQQQFYPVEIYTSNSGGLLGGWV